MLLMSVLIVALFLVGVYLFFDAAFGDVFASIGVREPQPQASEVFTTFGEAHRSIERYAIKMLKTVKPVCEGIRFVF
jgi:hypothetical protein